MLSYILINCIFLNLFNLSIILHRTPCRQTPHSRILCAAAGQCAGAGAEQAGNVGEGAFLFGTQLVRGFAVQPLADDGGGGFGRAGREAAGQRILIAGCGGGGTEDGVCQQVGGGAFGIVRFEVLADLVGHGRAGGGGGNAGGIVGGAGKAGGHHVEQYAGTLPVAGVAAGLVCLCFPVGGGFQIALCLGGVFIVVGQLGQLAVVLGFLADVAADGADGGVELPGDALLQGQFFFHPLAVKAVFQVACGGVGSLGTPIGVDACRSLLYALSVAALLFGGVGNLNVSRADAASGGAALAVLLFAEAEALAEAAAPALGDAVGVALPLGGPADVAALADFLFAFAVDAAAHAEAEALAAVAAVVGQVALAEAAGLETVAAVLFGALAGNDEAAVELGMAGYGYLKAVVAGIQAGLFAGAEVVGVGFALAVFGVAGEAVADGDLDVAVELFAAVAFTVLRGGDVEVAGG